MLRFPPHLSNELVWRQKYTIWLMLWPSDESGLPSHVTRNTQHICPMGPCLVLAQLSHVAIPFSHKDSLIPTEFQADEWGHQKCCLFFFFPGYPRLVSFFGEAGYWCTLGNKGEAKVSRSRHRLWGFGVRGERGPARDSFHISPEDIKKTGRAFSLPNPSCSTPFPDPVLATPGSPPPRPQYPPGWSPQAPYLSA